MRYAGALSEFQPGICWFFVKNITDVRGCFVKILCVWVRTNISWIEKFQASSTFCVGQQFFKTIAGMYSSFSDDSVPFRQPSERDISQSCVGSIVSKKKELDLSDHRWSMVFGGYAHSVMWRRTIPTSRWSGHDLSSQHSSETLTEFTHHGIWIEPM